MLFASFLSLSTLAAASLLPRPATPPHIARSFNSKCTFTLWHRQQASVDYVQLNTISDHANNMTVDVASRRPAGAFNSYTRLDRGHSLAVAGLLDDTRLSVAYAGDGTLSFQVGEVEWIVEEVNGQRGKGEVGEAWCDASGWTGEVDRRERRLDCVFPCEEADSDDQQNDGYTGAPRGEGQARIVT